MKGHPSLGWRKKVWPKLHSGHFLETCLSLRLGLCEGLPWETPHKLPGGHVGIDHRASASRVRCTAGPGENSCVFSASWGRGKPQLTCPKRIDLLTFWFFPFWSIFSKGPKRLTFYFQVFWASETRSSPVWGSPICEARR